MASRAFSSLNLNDAETALTWIVMFKAQSRAKNWLDKPDQKQITDNFMALCGIDSLMKIMAIVQPNKLEDMNFVDIEKAISAYLAPKKKLVIAERAKFFGEMQKPNEKITEFVARLRDQAQYCDFEELKSCISPQEEMVRMALLSGIYENECKSKVLVQMHSEDMNVSRIIEYVQQLEQISQFAKPTNKPSIVPPDLATDVHFSRTHVQHSTSRSFDKQLSGKQCSNCCKKGHVARQCRAKPKSKVQCYKCNKYGHYANECHGIDDSPDTNNEECDYTDVFSIEASMGRDLKTIRIKVSGSDHHDVLMQEDTGASCTIISTRIWEQIGKPKLDRYRGLPLRSYDGTALKIIGTLEVLVSYKTRYDIVKIKVVKSQKGFGLIGRDMISEQLHLVSAQSLFSVDQSAKLGTIRNIKASLRIPKGTKPIFCSAREVPLPLQASVEAELASMVEMGVISEVEAGGSEWASPMVCARKADGSLRLCCDYKTTINRFLLNDAYHPPDLETVFAKLEGAKVFAKFDLSSAYWQIELDEESKKLTTINTTKGLFQFNRLPFGIKTASSIFQRTMEKICAGLEGVIVYQDDLLVFAENTEILSKRTENLLQRLNKRNVSINWSKSVRQADSISFLGQIVSSDGIKPDKRLVEKVLQIKPPTTRKEVEQFMGLVNYYGSKIHNLAHISEPINSLRKSGVPFSWGESQQDAFLKLKEVLASEKVVMPYSLHKEVTLECDASEKAIGAILSQEGHPVIYMSRLLTSAEKNYAVVEREALAVVWAVKRAEKFLLGRHFRIRSDHRA